MNIQEEGQKQRTSLRTDGGGNTPGFNSKIAQDHQQLLDDFARVKSQQSSKHSTIRNGLTNKSSNQQFQDQDSDKPIQQLEPQLMKIQRRSEQDLFQADPQAPFQNPDRVLRAFLTSDSQVSSSFDRNEYQMTEERLFEEGKQMLNKQKQSVLVHEEPQKFMNINSESFKKLPFHIRAQHIAKAKEAKLQSQREEKLRREQLKEELELKEYERIQAERLKRARDKSNSKKVTYQNPKKAPQIPYTEAQKETVFQPQISVGTKKLIQEKRSSLEEEEQPTRYLRPVDFVIYDPQRHQDFINRQEEGAMVSQLLNHLLTEKYKPSFTPHLIANNSLQSSIISRSTSPNCRQ
ncbi:hypothetical protein FGO68_gene102 [Halteria grandinella]|uniref:Uncharacterized protein n=1 Tax=Halteria grandinella TaxID=5974 RepID=A0A8J8NR61_HALGN|nr:hypothetical protein FGO68_gene102 [Halteria grandinella]